ncbi:MULTISPECIES: type II toxin-antitoxin system HicB family antitoxin [Mycobacteriaceae]|uniref:Type II toxin-antitoxin system HicB family antitoxin n=2 Tax=Mycolicibacterium mucogenicum TaxID=56689 RepID=A0A8H2J8R5_MYCMU|nr:MULTISPECIES: type II toxin-antitoxin system HicB family antitoxin [Mycobacteriaceae]MCX8555715.1 type II toxin-antitoxin system HicB family antitoxin [Mycolicibacterium mucogenicum]QPG69670.1 type II toxin-antitoxin system HicB family antitoxin [Mycolicibacterium mucogenicum DSM 44124]TDK92494.1 type II toxin-antitoxin system HicB family antitoxin [Mycolicibacterium mucogenicum]SEB24697.1 HicB family protein [Mycobacterium sp. 283mftsu]GCB01243.1 antitoxin HicB [Mycolicibacterium sp. NCC-T
MTQYTYRAEWSPERGRYLAGCLEFPRLWATGMTAATAIAAMEQTVADEVRDLLASEMSPPESITDRKYSGKFLLRMPTAMHAKLSVEAAEQGVSLNQWVVQKLAARPPSFDDF